MATTVLGVLFVINIRLVFSCKQAFMHEAGCTEPIPEFALDICFKSQLDNKNYSCMFYCDPNYDGLYLESWNNRNCSGQPQPNFHFNFASSLDIDTIECSKSQCKHVMLKIFDSKSCQNIGDFGEIPMPINFCIKTQVNGFSELDSNKIYYVSRRCSNSTVQMVYYQSIHCTGDPIYYYTLFENGVCAVTNQMVEITHCDMEDIASIDIDEYTRLFVSFVSIEMFLWFVGFLVSAYFAVQLFLNLYEFKRIYVWHIPVFCKIQLSDLHNWIIEPSSSNKIYAFVSLISYNLSFISNAASCGLSFDPKLDVNSISTKTTNYLLQQLFGTIGQISFYLYLISTLEYYMKVPEIRIMISNKYMMVIKYFMVSSTALVNITTIIIDFYNMSFDNKYLVIWLFVAIVRDLIIESSILYLYYSGLNNVCHYWASKQYEEYEKYGENERVHELIITIARASVIISTSVVMLFGAGLICCLYMYQPAIVSSYTAVQTVVESLIITVVMCSYLIIRMLSIYFIYPFGHTCYEKKICCYYCDKRMYKYLLRKHQKQVENGTYDGVKYNYDIFCGSCGNNTRHLKPDKLFIELQPN